MYRNWRYPVFPADIHTNIIRSTRNWQQKMAAMDNNTGKCRRTIPAIPNTEIASTPIVVRFFKNPKSATPMDFMGRPRNHFAKISPHYLPTTNPNHHRCRAGRGALRVGNHEITTTRSNYYSGPNDFACRTRRVLRRCRNSNKLTFLKFNTMLVPKVGLEPTQDCSH